jgi:hypothetical protein
VVFEATTSDEDADYEWQADFGQGFQSLVDVGDYSGTQTANLVVSDLAWTEHQLAIRAISNNGFCADTSEVAAIQLTDTCFVTVVDTLFETVVDTVLLSVTDTLFIQLGLSGLDPLTFDHTLRIYPNPANDHITIDYGDFEALAGHQLVIENALGQAVFATSISAASSYVSLASWSGPGLYFVQVLDAQGNVLDTKKIVLQ